MDRIQMRAAGAAKRLRRTLGSEGIVTDETRLAELGGDKWFAHHRPDLAVFPQSSAEVSEVMKVAAESRLPVTTRGAGYGYVGGCVPAKGGIVLAMKQMNRIKEIDGADFIAVVEPGVITGDLQSAARKKGSFYPPDPAVSRIAASAETLRQTPAPRC
jgi:FAD/FMN-containing dehydrogenase